MARSVDEYLEHLQQLLPQGPAWSRDPAALISKILSAFGAEFSLVETRAEDLLDESDPRTTNEMLADWESDFGLPDPCGDQLGNTVELRREVLTYKVTSLGGQSRQFYIDLAAKLGYTITITELYQWRINSRINLPIYGQEWNFVWRVNAPATTVRNFRIDSRVDTPLAIWGNQLLECNISRIKPAHTVVQFSYS